MFTDKELYNMRQANYMQLRKLCEVDTWWGSEASPEPSEAAPEPSEAAHNPSGAHTPKDLLRLVATLIEVHSRGLLSDDAALHAVRELVKNS